LAHLLKSIIFRVSVSFYPWTSRWWCCSCLNHVLPACIKAWQVHSPSWTVYYIKLCSFFIYWGFKQ